MKSILYLIISTLVLSSCSGTKNYLDRSNQDKTLFDIVKRLNKKTTDEEATAALPTVYIQVQQRHLKNIDTYRTYKDISRWDKLYNEYRILQDMFEAINSSGAASKLVTPVSFQNEITDIKNAAAEDYYQLGDTYLNYNTRDYAKKAYAAFKKADWWIKDYRDSKLKMDDAFNSSIINIIVNPIQDNSFFMNTGWGNIGYNFSNEYFQQNLVRDLGGKYASRYPARFYTDKEAGRENLPADWVVDLTLRNMNIPRPAISNFTRKVSKQIENGKDTTGKRIYITVSGVLRIKRQSFTARAQMDMNVFDVVNQKSITYNTYSDTYYWQQEYATYEGDKRALSDEDRLLLNADRFVIPVHQEILKQLYRNIYPQVKNRLAVLADW